jgi:hypothetical protein
MPAVVGVSLEKPGTRRECHEQRKKVPDRPTLRSDRFWLDTAKTSCADEYEPANAPIKQHVNPCSLGACLPLLLLCRNHGKDALGLHIKLRERFFARLSRLPFATEAVVVVGSASRRVRFPTSDVTLIFRSGRPRRHHREGMLEAHDLESGVDVNDVAGHPAPEVACQEYGSIGYLGRIGVATEGRVAAEAIEDLRKILDPAGGSGCS